MKEPGRWFNFLGSWESKIITLVYAVAKNGDRGTRLTDRSNFGIWQ